MSEGNINSNKQEKSLTTSQTGETRLVTKVRFIIEKQNSNLKNKKALDNIRNTQAGHILIDYRICCAMINFNMKPCVPDGKDTVEISQRIKQRCSKKQNKLESLLDMKFTSTVSSVQINSITDFPKLTLSQFKKRITLGSYKIRQCQSYIEQIIEHGKAYSLQNKQIEKHVKHPKVKHELNQSKLIAVLTPSRHKRGKKWKQKNKENNDESNNNNPKNYNTYYKVFIQYVPSPIIESEQRKVIKPYHQIKRKKIHIVFQNSSLLLYKL